MPAQRMRWAAIAPGDEGAFHAKHLVEYALWAMKAGVTVGPEALRQPSSRPS
jgi:hypothetical protein